MLELPLTITVSAHFTSKCSTLNIRPWYSLVCHLLHAQQESMIYRLVLFFQEFIRCQSVLFIAIFPLNLGSVCDEVHYRREEATDKV